LVANSRTTRNVLHEQVDELAGAVNPAYGTEESAERLLAETCPCL
jgi:hypothetical protein